MTQTVTLVRAPLDISREQMSRVNAGEHLALGTPSEIAANGDRAFDVRDASPNVPAVEHSISETGMLGVLRAAEMPQEVVAGTLQWSQSGTTKQQTELDKIDVQDLGQTRAELEQLWGDKYGSNAKALARYVERLPTAAAEIVRNARDPATGRAYLNDPANVVRLAGLARAPQPQGEGPLTIEAVEGFMRTNRAAYNKDEALQARFRELLLARERTKG
jgi:hypothetical protein